MAKIGFIGLGNMGVGMASRLLAAGHELSVYNRTKSKAENLVHKGAVLTDTPRMAAQGADAIIAMVSDDIASRDIWRGENGALSAAVPDQAIIIECSTLSYDWVMQLSKVATEHGFSYLDCPVTGLPDAAASGLLTLFLGGDQATIERAQPFLTPVSKSQLHFGGIGSGTAYKLIVNLMGSIQITATAEALLLAEKAGLDLKLVGRALAMGAAGSPNVIRSSEQMIDSYHEENVLFNAALRLKDSIYGVELAKYFGQDAALGEIAREVFQKTVDAGYGKHAESKIIDVLKRN